MQRENSVTDVSDARSSDRKNYCHQNRWKTWAL